MIDFFADLYGPYPFTSFGAIVDDDTVDYALETQTRPVYSQVATESTVAHELAHQWVGDSVSGGQQRLAGDLARHLAQRGLRDLLRVDGGRVPRRPDRAAAV